MNQKLYRLCEKLKGGGFDGFEFDKESNYSFGWVYEIWDRFVAQRKEELQLGR
jgi:hypothetical protein